jgi:septal ring factor EnvC (AmiA/AmiB activator)
VTLSPTTAARGIIAAAAMVWISLAVWAQSPPSAENARKQPEADKSLLDAKRKAEADVERLAAERARISARLVETGKQIQQIEARQNAIKSKLGDLQTEEKSRHTQLTERHGAISTLLAALQRMGRNPPPVMITRREDALTMVRSAMLVAYKLPELEKKATKLKQDLGELARLIKSKHDESEKLEAERVLHEAARIRLTADQEKKRQLEAKRQADLDSLRAAIAKIAKNVAKNKDAELNDLVAGVDKEVAQRGPALLAPSGQRVAMLSPGRIKPQVPFTQAKGMLPLPIQGLRVVSFGDRTQYGHSKGIGIRARYGGTVVSPCDGLVVYAGEFRTYGHLLIISPGDGYHVLIAGLSKIDVQVGQSVLMGEPVGEMSSAIVSAAAKDRGPVLTVEFQKDRRPIDPDPWWSDASRKGQG